MLYSRTRHPNLLGGMSRERAGDDDGVVVVVELRETMGVTVVGARVDDEVTALVVASVRTGTIVVLSVLVVVVVVGAFVIMGPTGRIVVRTLDLGVVVDPSYGRTSSSHTWSCCGEK